MKGRILSVLLIFALSLCFLASCGEGKKAEFNHCELTLVLDKGYEQEKSEDFDLLLSNGDVAVSLLRISFEAGFQQGIPDTYTAKGFAAFFMNKSEKSDTLLMRGDVPYYTYTEDVGDREIFYTVTFYRSFDAYFMVAYATDEKNKGELSEKFLEYAEAAYFNNAPEINKD